MLYCATLHFYAPQYVILSNAKNLGLLARSFDFTQDDKRQRESSISVHDITPEMNFNKFLKKC